MRELNALFAAAFEDPASYQSSPPSESYVRQQLEDERTIVLAAYDKSTIVGGLVAYLLRKLEQERSEIYIYDLAVAEGHRRRGVATALDRRARADRREARRLGDLRSSRLRRRPRDRALHEARQSRGCDAFRH